MPDDLRIQAVTTVLNQLVGDWEGVAQTWFEAETPVDTSPIRGSFRQIGDSRFVLYTYEGAFQGSALSGAALYGYNQWSDSFESAWVDSFHMPTNIMASNGSAGTTELDVIGSYAVENSPPWGWRTIIGLDDANHLTLTTYNRSPDGDEMKAVEIVYTRVNVSS